MWIMAKSLDDSHVTEKESKQPIENSEVAKDTDEILCKESEKGIESAPKKVKTTSRISKRISMKEKEETSKRGLKTFTSF